MIENCDGDVNAQIQILNSSASAEDSEQVLLLRNIPNRFRNLELIFNQQEQREEKDELKVLMYDQESQQMLLYNSGKDSYFFLPNSPSNFCPFCNRPLPPNFYQRKSRMVYLTFMFLQMTFSHLCKILDILQNCHDFLITLHFVMLLVKT
jgi:hypothetical protein